MKRRIMFVNWCVALSLLLNGCQFVSKIEKEEKQSEIVTEAVTETEDVDMDVNVESEAVKSDNKAAVGLGAVQVVPRQEAATESEIIQGYEETEPEIIQVYEETESEIIQIYGETEAVSYQEEYMQCPYCAHWFGTEDDGNGIPYDRHLEEERATDSAYGLTEAELAECPDCGNWYPTGNIFRNHICEGRQ